MYKDSDKLSLSLEKNVINLCGQQQGH